jgi:hypothetical protein
MATHKDTLHTCSSPSYQQSIRKYILFLTYTLLIAAAIYLAGIVLIYLLHKYDINHNFINIMSGRSIHDIDWYIRIFSLRYSYYIFWGGVVSLLSLVSAILGTAINKKHFAVVVSLLIIILFIVEAIIRIAIFSDALSIPSLRKASLYTNGSSIEDWYKLEHIFRKNAKPYDHRTYHPLFGHSQSQFSENNTLGLMDHSLSQIFSGRKSIPVYGDSFIRGEASKEYQLPNYLSLNLPGLSVIDLSQPGFGVDQIYLMFDNTLELITNKSIAIIGIYTGDLDRTLYNIFEVPKPRYSIVNNELVLQNAPIDIDIHEFINKHPPNIYSYVFSAGKNFIQQLLGIPDANIRHKDKIHNINNALITKILNKCNSHNTIPIFVIFYSLNEIASGESWRGDILRNILPPSNVIIIDTMHIIKNHSLENNTLLSEYYGAGGHHNNLGHKIIGDSVLNIIRIKLANSI